MVKKVVVASGNKGKIKEISEIFSEYEVLPIKKIEEILGKEINVSENQETFVGNALEKVRDMYNQIGSDYICIADDSGISIDALNGFPGVHTARWMEADDHTKNLALLQKMEGIKDSQRTCYYTTVIALKCAEYEKTFEYSLDGIVSDKARGNNGFGFDEIFEIANGKTLAEITMEEKLSISPRKKALEKISEFMKNNNL